jgi:hypothetical protein
MSRSMLLTFCLFSALSCVSAGQTVAYKDGNRLLSSCDTEDFREKAYCCGYIAGAMDSQVTFQESMKATVQVLKPDSKPMPNLYCLPDGGLEMGQALRVVVKWLKDHPEKLHQRADALILNAFVDGFPCR